MEEQKCIVCGRAFPAGLHIMGCLICFPCAKMLLRGTVSRQARRRLARLCAEPLLRAGQEI